MAPSKDPDPFDQQFEAAVRELDAGRPREAAMLLEALLVDRLDRRWTLALAHTRLGGIYMYELADQQAAERHFRTATKLSPSSELASLCLFHCLIGQERFSAAFAEARRFTGRSPSQEYRRTLWEINHPGEEYRG